ncbi:MULTISPECIES: hypothetical protein [unclassified Microbacterium]|uniref:hypothetical protein n=1 Tax=unclassified Microbacterium TaxID=2609290 RepID=UPI00109D1063|nr:hypothetical protein [Microbacterium sp. K41]
MTPSSFDDELAAAAAIVRSENAAAQAKAEQEQQVAAQELQSLGARGAIWNDFLDLGRECAAKLRQAGIKPPVNIDSWVQTHSSRKPLDNKNSGYRAWQIFAGQREHEVVKTSDMLLREDGQVGWRHLDGWGKRFMKQTPVTLANFPHPVPDPWPDPPAHSSGLRIHEGKVVVLIVESYFLGDTTTYHLFDAREALLVETVRLLDDK